MDNVGIIIQARTGSTRLPNKMTLPFYNNHGILELILQRLTNLHLNIPIIVATTTNKSDDIIELISLNNKTYIFRGSQDNVLDRFIKAAEKHCINKIIRICADNPFLDLKALKYQINSFKSDVDYLAYALSDNTPTIKTHYGFWTEGIKLSALKKIQKLTSEKLFQEHVTNYIYTNAENFKIQLQHIPLSLEQNNNIRLTVDTLTDFNIAKKIYTNLISKNINIEAEYIVEYLINHKDYINSMQTEILKNKK